jgi:hypothetical protein
VIEEQEPRQDEPEEEEASNPGAKTSSGDADNITEDDDED